MSEEEAIKMLENIKNSKRIRTELKPFGYAMAIKQITNYTIGTKEFSAIETVLNLIQKQQEEIKLLRDQQQYVIDEYSETIEKKDKIINELEDKISLIETYYDISDLDKIVKEDM